MLCFEMARYNLKSPAVKRLMKEAEELREATEEYFAQPLEDNLFEWHFTLRGPPTTEFDGGIYHGRISLPTEYPMKPPSIILLTPNGRFEVNKKICLSISGHHPETWQPSWSIRTALLAMIGFFPTHGNGAIGSLDYTPEERKTLAAKSQNWKCSDCGYIKDVLKKNVELAKNIELSKNVELSKDTELSNIELSQMERIKVLEEKLERDCRIIEAASSGSSSLLLKTKSEREKIRLSKIGQIKLHGSENGVIPQRSTSDKSRGKRDPLPRNRHLTPNQEVHNSEPVSLVATKESSDEIKNVVQKKTNCVYNYCSLLIIWIIAIMLGILIARRILY